MTYGNRGFDYSDSYGATMSQQNEMRRAYGTADPIAIREQLEEERQQKAHAQVMDLYEQKQAAEIEQKRTSNRLGISPLTDQLGDRYSAAYEPVYGPEKKNAAELGAGIQMTIGDVVDAPGGEIPGPSFQDAKIIGDKGYTAPAPLGISPLAGLSMSRGVRKEFQPAMDMMGGNKVSPYENPIRAEETQIKKLAALTNLLENLEDDTPLHGQVLSEIAAISGAGGSPAPVAAPVAQTPAPTPTPAPAAAKGPVEVNVMPENPSLEDVAAFLRSKNPNTTDEQIRVAYEAGQRQAGK